jgi:hypothetical protein
MGWPGPDITPKDFRKLTGKLNHLHQELMGQLTSPENTIGVPQYPHEMLFQNLAQDATEPLPWTGANVTALPIHHVISLASFITLICEV